MKEEKIFKIKCPHCHIELWVDSISQKVIKYEKNKNARRKKTLDHLLLKEKKRIQEFDRKFEATFELQKVKKKELEKQFEKAFSKIDSESE